MLVPGFEKIRKSGKGQAVTGTTIALCNDVGESGEREKVSPHERCDYGSCESLYEMA